MISVTHSTYIPYDQIPESVSSEEKPDIVVYPAIFGGDITRKIVPKLMKIHSIQRFYKNITMPFLNILNSGIRKLTGISFDSAVINGKPRFNKCVAALVLFQDYTVRLRRIKDGREIPLEVSKGTMIILRQGFRKYWKCIFPRHLSVIFFKSDLLELSDVYLDQTHRTHLLQVIKDKLRNVSKLPYGKQCINKFLKLEEMLGSGDYGNVYLATMGNFKFAIKLAKLKPGAVDNPYSRYNSSWYEILIMKDILRPMIQDHICPNLPLLIESFVCNKCTLTIRKETKEQPCITTITELANGSIRDFFKYHEPEPEEIYSALFQVMAGLHAIQLHGQIMNYDVKADNILFYNVTPGGYWVYVIHGKEYYVPNLGKLFVVNDFGISRPMSPDFQLYRTETDETFRLGSRFAMVKKGKFWPITSNVNPDHQGNLHKSSTISWDSGKETQGSQYRLWKESQEVMDNDTIFSKDQISFLSKQGLSTDPKGKDYFMNPEIIPPFEFYNDLQDAIRTFIGGKRTTQKGDHKRYPVITDDIFKRMNKFNGKGENMNSLTFSKDPSEVLAGYFIEKFFYEEVNYRKKLKGQRHGRYVMS